jgi:hypothetical protein
MELRTTNHKVGWHEVNTIKLTAIRGKGIDLTGLVLRPLTAIRGEPEVAEPNHDNVAVHPCPLALNAKKPAGDLEDEVVPAMLCHRLQDRDSEVSGRRGDLELRYRALHVRLMRLHERMFPLEPDGRSGAG